MKARKSFLALVASAMVVNMAPVATFANETDTAVNAETDLENTTSETSMSETNESEENAQPAEAAVKHLSLKFVDAEGNEVVVEDSEEEPKYSRSTEGEFESVQEGFYKTVFDLSELNEEISIDQEKLPEGIQAQFNSETKELTVIFGELLEDKEIVVELAKAVETDEAEQPTESEDEESDRTEEEIPGNVDNTIGDTDIAVTDENETAILTINFIYSDSKRPVGQPCVLEVQKNNPDEIAGEYPLPSPVGYELNKGTVVSGNGLDLRVDNGKLYYSVKNVQSDMNVFIEFAPAEVTYTVNYFQQNVDNDEYKQVDSVRHTGTTNTAIKDDLNPKDLYEGFYPLNYDKTEKIAADGSTVINIYYDRNYYMLSFDLDGGFGTEPVYGRYGAPVSVVDPQKPGHSFSGWEDENDMRVEEIPATIPAKNVKYKAIWDAEIVNFTVVFWTENANDDKYSMLESRTYREYAGAVVNSADYQNEINWDDKKHFSYNPDRNIDITVQGDGSTVVNVYFTRREYTYTLRRNRRVIHTFKAKYQQNIWDEWEFTANDVNYPHYDRWDQDKVASWKPTEKTDAGVIQRICRQQIMEGKNITWDFTTKDDGKTNYYYYFVESLPGAVGDKSYYEINYSQKYYLIQDFNQVVEKEEFFEIEGFTKKVATSQSRYGSETKIFPGKKYVSTGKRGTYRFYYTRNKYNLTFHNFDDKKVATDIPYELPLNDYFYEPSFPSGSVEEGSMVFEGWYTSEHFEPETKFDFSTEKMPAANVALFAHWVPVSHTVKFYTDHTMTTQHDKTHTVPHGSFIQEPVEAPVNPAGTFVGWFYKDENGNEKAFDLENSPVNRDLELYAKHTSDTIVSYTVKYVYKDPATNEEIEIAPQTVASGLVNITKTHPAKTGTDLNEGYQEGYFPEVRSSSIVLGVDEEKNVLTFYYVKAPTVPYVVRYVDSEGNTLLPEKPLKTSSAVVTEYAPFINGYVVDSYAKSLIVEYDTESSTPKNVIEFVYTKDSTRANYAVRHMLDDSDKPYAQSSGVDRVDAMLKPDPLTITNYVLEEVVVMNGDGSEIATVPADQWAAQAEFQLTEKGKIFEFRYAGTYQIYYKHNMLTPVVRKVSQDRQNGYDAAGAVPKSHLYAGLYEDETFTTPLKANGEHGKKLQPTTGRKYYVKTISNQYMIPALYMIYNINSDIVNRIDVVTTIDDNMYKSVSNGVGAGELFETLRVYNIAGGKDKTYKASDFSNVPSGLLSADMIHSYYPKVDEEIPTWVSKELAPSHVTPDGVNVGSRVSRIFTLPKMDRTKLEIQNILHTGDTTSVPSATAEYAPRKVKPAYELVEGVEDTKPEEPEKTTITVTKVVDGISSAEEKEKGNLVNAVAYPEVNGKVFAGWYADSAFTVPAKLDNVTEDITLYAQYIPMSELTENVKRLYRFGKNTSAEVSLQLDHDLFAEVTVDVTLNGSKVPVELTKKKVQVGSLFDKLFGKAKTVTEYSDTIKLKKESNTDILAVEWTLVTVDGTVVALPTASYTVTPSSIK